MAIFPKIQSPCPYKSRLASVMDGDMCRMCKRQVFDLTDMSDQQRMSFLAGCAGEVCVSYRLPFRPALAAAAMVAAVVPTALAAQTQAAPVEEAALIDALDQSGPDEGMIIVGGIKDPRNVEFIEDRADSLIPELPVVYEDEPVEQAALPRKSVSDGDTAARGADQGAGRLRTSVIPSH
jgi:predicted Fe-S protein YdhL (DUF1289 family)